MYKHLFRFLDNNSALYQNQYGFRRNHSTTQAILEFITNTVETLEEKKQHLGYFWIYQGPLIQITIQLCCESSIYMA